MNSFEDLVLQPRKSLKPLTSTQILQKLRASPWPYSISLLRAALAYTVIPNLPFWVVAHLLCCRGTVNLDYLAVAVISVFVTRAQSLFLFAAVFVLQALTIWLAFYFPSEREAFFSIRYILELPWTRLLSTALLLAFIACAMALITETAAGNRWQRPRARGASLLAGVLALLLLFTTLDSDAMNRAVWHADNRPARVLSSVALHLLKAKFFPYSADDSLFTGGAIDSATVQYLHGPRPAVPAQGTPHNLVLVVVESYGLTTDTALRAQVVDPYLQPATSERYNVRFGAVPFLGGTISGEFRELCGLQLPISAIRYVPEFAGGCLPQKLARLGYHSTAFHGFARGMFDRYHWWPQIGFQQTYFYDDMAAQLGVGKCEGTFPAICDADMVRSIRATLLAAPPRQPQFIHWVSINSHLPISPSTRVPDRLHCGLPSALIADADLCRWAGLISIVNEAVAQLAADPALPPTDFIIVGDHAPPYISADRRRLFSYTQVPVIYLDSKR